MPVRSASVLPFPPCWSRDFTVVHPRANLRPGAGSEGDPGAAGRGGGEWRGGRIRGSVPAVRRAGLRTAWGCGGNRASRAEQHGPAALPLRAHHRLQPRHRAGVGEGARCLRSPPGGRLRYVPLSR